MAVSLILPYQCIDYILFELSLINGPPRGTVDNYRFLPHDSLDLSRNDAHQEMSKLVELRPVGHVFEGYWISDPSGTICDIIAAEQHISSLSKPPLAQIYGLKYCRFIMVFVR